MFTLWLLHPWALIRSWDKFKAWSSRRLNEHEGTQQHSGAPSLALGAKRWWTHGGWKKRINDEDYLLNAIRYVVELQ
jgi:hypothetical protein